MKKNIKILVVSHKNYKMPKDFMYLPVGVGSKKNELNKIFVLDDTGDNIAKRNNQYSELTALYWAWKNLEYDYLGIVHYRRYMALKKCKSLDGILSEEQVSRVLEEYEIITARPQMYIESIKNHYVKCHKTQHDNCRRQIEILGEVIKRRTPMYYEYFQRVMNSHSAHMFNMFIMSKENIDDYCNWIFPILFETEILIDKADLGYERLMGSLSEFLLDVWILKNNKGVKNMYLYQTEMDLFKRVQRFLYRRFFEK